MTLHKSVWKAAVLMGIAGVLMFAGGAWAADSVVYTDAELVCNEAGKTWDLTYGTEWKDVKVDGCKVTAKKNGTAATDVTSDLTISLVTTTGIVSAKPGANATNDVKIKLDAKSGNTIVLKSAASGTAGTQTVEATHKYKIVKARVKADMLKVNTGGEGKDTVPGFEDRLTIKAAMIADKDKDNIVLSDALTALGLQKFGAVTLRWAKVTNKTTGAIGSFTNVSTTSAPSDTGKYAILAYIAGNDYYLVDSIMIRGKASYGGATFVNNADVGLDIDFDDGSTSWVVAPDFKFEYNPIGTYTFPWPTILDAYYGVRDTVVLDPTAALTWTKDNEDKSKKAGTIVHATTATAKNFTLTTQDTGEVTVKLLFRAQYQSNPKYVWETDGSVTFKVTIDARNLGTSTENAAGITADVLGTYTYTGDTITPVIGNILVKYNGVVIANGSQVAYDVLPEADETKNNVKWEKADGTGDWNRTFGGRDGNVFVVGKGKFKGIARASFAIAKKPITFAVSPIYAKTYDGTTALSTNPKKPDPTDATKDKDNTTDGETLKEDKSNAAFVWVTFNGLGYVLKDKTKPDANDNRTYDALALTEDYNLKSATLDNANVGKSRLATVTLEQITAGPVSRNYTITNTTVTQNNREVKILTPDSTHFSIAIPAADAKYFNNNRQPIPGTLDLKKPMTNSPATVQLRYAYGDLSSKPLDTEAEGKDQNFSTDTSVLEKGKTTEFTGDTTVAPKTPGTYGVYAKVSTGGTNITPGYYFLGTYKINDAAEAHFDIKEKDDDKGNLSTEKIEKRQTNTFTLSVTATSPNGGTLSYKWYVINAAGDTTEVREDNKSINSPTVTLVASKQGEFKYFVRVTNSKAGVQVPTTVKSNETPVSVGEPPTRLNGTLTIDKTLPWVYSGYAIEPTGDGIVTLTQIDRSGEEPDTSELEEGKDFVLEYSGNTNVGTARVTARGIDNYTGSVRDSFVIVAKDLEPADFNGMWTQSYTGSPAVVNIRARSPMTGMGTITATYGGSATVPTNAGKYDVEVVVTAGTNFKGTGSTPLFINTLTIERKVPALADFLMADGSAFKIPTNHKIENAGTKFGIGAVKLKGTGFGEIEILYDGFEMDEDAVWEQKSYNVLAVVSGGDNYEDGEVVLGTYTIGTVSVLDANREVPKTDVTEVVTIAPVKVKPAAALTAGPSPVKLGGEITFFSKSNGSIYIFDANGSNVAKLSAKSGKTVWNLKDKKGVTVSEGTYVAVSKAGSEKASFKFSVVK